MIMNSTIFRGLASKDCENTTTGLLANLMRYKYLRDIIMDFLFGNDYEKTSSPNIFTQRKFKLDDGTEAIPDITIETSNCLFLIENKVKNNCPLEESQKSGYQQVLDKYGKGKCVFLLPDNYSYENDINDHNTERKKWSELLEILLKAQVKETSSVVTHAIDYFMSVIDVEQIKESNNKISLYEAAFQYHGLGLEKMFNELSNQKTKIIEWRDSIVGKLGKEFPKHTIEGDGETAFNPYQFGAYIRVKKTSNKHFAHNIWIGCIVKDDAISKYISIRQDSVNETSLNTCNYQTEDGWYYFKLNKDDEIVDDCVETLKKCHSIFKEE